MFKLIPKIPYFVVAKLSYWLNSNLLNNFKMSQALLTFIRHKDNS